MYNFGANPILNTEQWTTGEHDIIASILIRMFDIAENANAESENRRKRQNQPEINFHRPVSDVMPGQERTPVSRPHCVFTVDGPRGAGKTTVLLTLYELFFKINEGHPAIEQIFDKTRLSAPMTAQLGQKLYKRPEDYKKSKKLAYALPILYPDLREGGQASTMDEIFASLDFALKQIIDDEQAHYHDQFNEKAYELQRTLRKDVGQGWLFAQDFGQDALKEDASSYQDFNNLRWKLSSHSRRRRTVWHKFVEDFLEAMGCELLVVTIDDSDLEPYTASEVARTIHLYLSHPRIVTILGVDLSAFEKSLLEPQHRALSKIADIMDRYELATPVSDVEDERDSQTQRRLNPNYQGRTESWFEDNEYQTGQFLAKIFPLPQRQRIPTLKTKDMFRILYENSISKTRSISDTMRQVEAILYTPPQQAYSLFESFPQGQSRHEQSRQAELVKQLQILIRLWRSFGYRKSSAQLVARDLVALRNQWEVLQRYGAIKRFGLFDAIFDMPSTNSLKEIFDVLSASDQRQLTFGDNLQPGASYDELSVTKWSNSQQSWVFWFFVDCLYSSDGVLPSKVVNEKGMLFHEDLEFSEYKLIGDVDVVKVTGGPLLDNPTAYQFRQHERNKNYPVLNFKEEEKIRVRRRLGDDSLKSLLSNSAATSAIGHVINNFSSRTNEVKRLKGMMFTELLELKRTDIKIRLEDSADQGKARIRYAIVLDGLRRDCLLNLQELTTWLKSLSDHLPSQAQVSISNIWTAGVRDRFNVTFLARHRYETYLELFQSADLPGTGRSFRNATAHDCIDRIDFLAAAKDFAISLWEIIDPLCALYEHVHPDENGQLLYIEELTSTIQGYVSLLKEFDPAGVLFLEIPAKNYARYLLKRDCEVDLDSKASDADVKVEFLDRLQKRVDEDLVPTLNEVKEYNTRSGKDKSQEWAANIGLPLAWYNSFKS